MSNKIKAARLSIISNTSLVFMKLIVGIFTGSVSIISEAVHSTVDLLASVIAYFSVKISDIPADEQHPYGHGKIENVSGVIEALLIFLASSWIIYESIHKLMHPTSVKSIGLGFIIMFISAGTNVFVSKKLYKVAKEEDSVALEADALHLRVDVYTSLGVGFGLLLIYITKLNYLDPIVAIIVALFILKEACELLSHAFSPLLDVSLSDDEIEVIKNEMTKHSSVYCDYHNLRTRKSGSTKYVDLHLVVPQNMSVKNAHDVCDEIEASIENHLRNTQVLIHLESCDSLCNECGYMHKASCESKKKTD